MKQASREWRRGGDCREGVDGGEMEWRGKGGVVGNSSKSIINVINE